MIRPLHALLTGALLALAVAAQAQDAPRAPQKTPRRVAPKPASAPARKGLDLRRAYEKEYAFLASEELALRGRLAEVESARKARKVRAAARVAGLERKLRELKQQLKQEKTSLGKLEEQVAQAGESRNTLDAILSQAEAVRERYGRPALKHADGASAADRLEAALVDLDRLLREQGRVRVEPGAYFLQDGSEAKGQLVRVGGIATLGAGDAGSGALAPAGAGRLQLWNATSGAAAQAAAEGKQPATLPLYLYESTKQKAEREQTRSALETVEAGGIIAWIIVWLGVATGVLVVLRALMLALTRGRPERLFARVEPLLHAGRLDEAQALCSARTTPGLVLGRVVPQLHAGPEALESAATEGMLQASLRLDRFETAILVAAAVAPLLGLLGTVTGMISTFDVITVHGTGDPKLLSGGISEALITTQLGLTVAIPALLVGNLLSGWSEQIRAGTERLVLQTSIVAEALRGGGAPAAEVAERPADPEDTRVDLAPEEVEA